MKESKEDWISHAILNAKKYNAAGYIPAPLTLIDGFNNAAGHQKPTDGDVKILNITASKNINMASGSP